MGGNAEALAVGVRERQRSSPLPFRERESVASATQGEGTAYAIIDSRRVPHTKRVAIMPSRIEQNPVPPARRVSIIGATGAGKTLLARRIARVLPARVVHADSHIWGPGWTLRDRGVAEAELQAVLRDEPAWIAEGYLKHAAREMLELADLVIYLDLSRPRLLRNIVLRWWRHRRRRRPELPEGCEERLGFARLRLIATDDLHRLTEAALAAHPPRRLVRIRSPRELRRFLAAEFPAST